LSHCHDDDDAGWQLIVAVREERRVISVMLTQVASHKVRLVRHGGTRQRGHLQVE